MAEPATSESSPDTDRDFDPTADMLVHEFDDEHTLDEEEAMSGDTSCSDELDKLEKEQDMPIEQLLALYGYSAASGDDYRGEPVNSELHESRSSSEEEILSNQDLTLDKDVIARDLLKDEDHDKETSVNDLLDSVDMPSHTVRLLRSNSQAGSSDDDESADEDYQPEKDDDWKKVIQVGSDFQAAVPEGLCKYGDAPAYENEDRLLWDPTRLTDETVEKFLQEVHTQGHQGAQGVQAIPTGAHIRDDEQALYLLLQCGHNVEEAVRRRKMQAVPPTDPMSLWSEEECRNFENGLRTYGKDFHLIQQNKVRTRSVGELVQFYYLWKKTERHDMFANKTRLEKKKYILHPGVTDYMDRFLDDQENPAPVRDRSSSPNINSLIYGDPKRQNSPHKIYEDGLHATSDSNTMFSPIKLNPELNTALPTTVSINAELRQGQQQSAENIVHIANFAPTTAPAVSNSTESSWIESEPSPKRLKTECDEKTVLDNSAPSLLCTGTGDNTVSAEAEQTSHSDSNHVGNVALSISSVNSVHSIGDNNISSIASESSAIAAAQSMAQ